MLLKKFKDWGNLMATLAIEILDAASGKMAEDVQVQIRKIVDDEWQQLDDVQTDTKGAAVLCEGAVIEDGGYFEVLVFLGSYFDQSGRDLPQYKMVDIVPLRFGVESASRNITLRMSVTPHSYSADFATEIKRINLV
jgi:5-hydroxyisourate hydrolase